MAGPLRPVCFQPSRVEGIEDVREVCVYPDRLEIQTVRERRVIDLLSIAQGRAISTGRAPVGELWFSSSDYPESHFVFYTTPRIVIYMPLNGPTRHPKSVFWRVQEVLRAGGFKLYERGDIPLMPLLDPWLSRSIAWVLAILAFSWLFACSGFLPGQIGDLARRILLSNPANPAISFAFVLPATAVPLLLAVRHGKTNLALGTIVIVSYLVALASEWALRHVIQPWAPLDQPPFNHAVWSTVHFIRSLAFAAIATVVGATWRTAFREPLPSKRST